MKKLSPLLLLLAQTFFLCLITLFCAAPLSCRASEEGIIMLAGDYDAPKLKSFAVLDAHTLSLGFSEKVKLVNSVVSAQIEGLSDSMEHSTTEEPSPAIEAAAGKNGRIDARIEKSEDGLSFTLFLEQDCKVGRSYELFGTVADKMGNSLTFCLPFTGFNSSVPELIMTELQIKYAKATSGGREVFRSEFVEFLALQGGNLGGLELCSGADGESKKYSFPPVDVEKGQVFLVHLRTAGQGCIDERDDFNLASAPHSVAGQLDLWSENASARLNDSADVVILQNGVTGTVLDAFMYADAKTLEWKAGPGDFAEKAAAAGIYETGGVGEAALCSGLSPLKSFKRKDAAALREMELAGGQYAYPYPNGGDLWEVGPVSPGSL